MSKLYASPQTNHSPPIPVSAQQHPQLGASRTQIHNALRANQTPYSEQALDQRIKASLISRLRPDETKELSSLAQNLSDTQKTRLWQFFEDKALPAGFFDKNPPNKLTVGQKLLLSAFMISTGSSDPAQSSTDAIESMQQIHNYAGLTPKQLEVPGRKGNTDELRAGKDPLGYTHFGASTQERVQIRKFWYTETKIGDWLVVRKSGASEDEHLLLAGWNEQGYDNKEKSAVAFVYVRGKDGKLVREERKIVGSNIWPPKGAYALRSFFRMSAPDNTPPKIAPLDLELGPLSATQAQQDAEKTGDKDALRKRNFDRASALLDRLSLPKEEEAWHRMGLKEALDPKYGSASDADLQKIASIHRAMILRLLTSNAERVKASEFHPSRLALALYQKVMLLLLTLKLQPSDKTTFEEAIRNILPTDNTGQPKEGVSVEQITKLAAIVQRLSGDPVTGKLDKTLLQDIQAPKDKDAATQFGQGEGTRLFNTAFKAEFGRTLRADANEQLAGRFTQRQQSELMSFFTTRMIPKELFTGEKEAIKLSAKPDKNVELRTLIAGHILTLGRARDKDRYHPWAEVKLGANDCGHWANWVWNYAGLAPAGDTLAADPAPAATSYRNIKGPTRVLSFGVGAKQRIVEPSVKRKSRMKRVPVKNPLPRLKPGDWLMLRSSNPTGFHSVIFAGWETVAGAQQARLFHQRTNEPPFGSPQRGGYFDVRELLPSEIFQIDRVSDRMPARTREQLFEAHSGNPITSKTPSERKEMDENLGKTLSYMESHHIDPVRLWRVLSSRARTLIERPGEALTLSEPQKELFLALWQEHRFKPKASPTIFQLGNLVAIIQKIMLERPTGEIDDAFKKSLFEGILEDAQRDLADDQKKLLAQTLGKGWSNLRGETNNNEYRALEQNRLLVESAKVADFNQRIKKDLGGMPQQSSKQAQLAWWLTKKIDELESTKPTKGQKKQPPKLSEEQRQTLARYRPAHPGAEVALEAITELTRLLQYLQGKEPDGWLSWGSALQPPAK